MGEPPLYLSRYPGYDVLAFQEDWDDLTRKVVVGRVERVPPIRFFRPDEEAALRSLADVVLPQDDRPENLRVPLVELLDERLCEGETAGYRYEALPPDHEFWRVVARAWTEEARLVHRKAPAELSAEEGEALFAAVADGHGQAPEWGRLPLRWSIPQIVEELVRQYYSHPWAWNEIGFPGPKFPHVYARTMRENEDEALEVRRGGA